MKILLVLNPVSGGVDKANFLDQAKNFCTKYGYNLQMFETSGKDDEDKLKQQIQDFEPARVIAAGGDGTLLFTAKVLRKTGIPMGIVPLGSANGMATELFVNPNPVEAFKDALISQVFAGLDMLLVNNKHYSLHIGDVGINASIVESYSKDKNRGMATYAKYFIDELSRMEPFNITVKANNKTISEKGLMVGLCNARKYGTGIPLNIEGNPMDGKFEIVILKNLDLPTLIKAGLASFDERFHDSQNSLVISTDKAEVLFDKPMLLQLDGEVIGRFEKLDIAIDKHAIKLISHNDLILKTK